MKIMFGIVIILPLTVALSFAQTTPPLRVDHVPICVAELGPVQQAFAAAGLKSAYGGPHATGGTHMALLGFDDGSYFELLAPQKPGSAQGLCRSHVAGGECRAMHVGRLNARHKNGIGALAQAGDRDGRAVSRRPYASRWAGAAVGDGWNRAGHAG
jgi:Glyoxalase-like domain